MTKNTIFDGLQALGGVPHAQGAPVGGAREGPAQVLGGDGDVRERVPRLGHHLDARAQRRALGVELEREARRRRAPAVGPVARPDAPQRRHPIAPPVPEEHQGRGLLQHAGERDQVERRAVRRPAGHDAARGDAQGGRESAGAERHGRLRCHGQSRAEEERELGRRPRSAQERAGRSVSRLAPRGPALRLSPAVVALRQHGR